MSALATFGCPAGCFSACRSPRDPWPRRSAATLLGSSRVPQRRGGVRVGGDHRCGSFMNGSDDLGVVDPAQVAGGDGEVGMPELSLDYEQRDPLARHLHRMCVPELVWREPASDPRCRGGVVQLSADSGRSAWPPTCWATQDAEQSAGRQLPAELKPGVEVRPSPPVHPDLAPLITLPCRTTREPRLGSRSVSLRASASLMRSPARHSTTMIPRRRTSSGPSPAARITATISSTAGGSGGYRRPLFLGCALRGTWRRLLASGGDRRIQQWCGLHDVLWTTSDCIGASPHRDGKMPSWPKYARRSRSTRTS